jgi:hypothetical protein
MGRDKTASFKCRIADLKARRDATTYPTECELEPLLRVLKRYLFLTLNAFVSGWSG